MNYRPRNIAWISLLLAAALLAGCGASNMESAQKAIADVQAALAEAGPRAIKYVPGDVKTVTAGVAELQALFDKKDYDGVLAAAPPVLAKAKQLPAAAETARRALETELRSDWDSLAQSAPAALAAVQSRVDILSQASKLPEGMDAEQLELITGGLDKARDLWTRAGAAHDAGDLEVAVALGRAADNRAGELLDALGMSPA